MTQHGRQFLHLHLDGFHRFSGDMFIAALLDVIDALDGPYLGARASWMTHQSGDQPAP